MIQPNRRIRNLISLVIPGVLFAIAAFGQAAEVSTVRPALRPGQLIAPFKASPSGVINSSWVGGFGNWSTATDWTPSGSPNNSGSNTYNVTIDTASDSVTLDVAPTINTLTLGGASGSSDLFTRTNNLTVTGALTVNHSGSLFVQSVLNAGSLTNSGYVQIYSGATLHLTNQPSGLTDIPAGSFFYLQGSFTAGSQSGLAALGSIEGNLELANGQTTTVTPGTGTLNLAGGASLTVNPGSSATTLTVDGALANSGTVSDASVMNATTLTNKGSFTVSSGGSLNLTTLTNTGTFAVNHGGSVNVANTISDVPAGSTLDVYGTLNSGSVSTLNPLAGVEGSLFLGNGLATTITPGGGTLNVATSGTLFVDNPDTTTGTNLTISGNLNNAGVVYAGYSGPGPNELTVTGGLTNQSFASIYVRGNDTLNAATLSNSGTINISTGGALNLTGAGASTNSKAIDVGGTFALTGKGTLSLTTGSSIAGQGGSSALTNAGTIEGTGTISNLGVTNNGTILANQSTPLAIQPSSLGMANNGTLSVSASDTLQIGTSAGGALSNFSGTTLTGGTYKISGTLQFGSSGTTIATNAANITLTGAGQMLDFGNHNILAGFNDNAGAGVFKLTGGASLTTSGGNFVNNGAFTVSKGTTFTIGGSSFNFTQAAGTATVDGTLTSTTLGTLSVTGGSLDGAGTLGYNVVDNGTLSPGDSGAKTGKLTVSDTYSQGSKGALDIEINGATAGTKYDQLKVTQSATLGGTLNVDLGSGFTPTVGEKFTIVTASKVSGTFAAVNGLAINGTEHFTVTYQAGSVVLTVVSGALPSSSIPPAAFHPGMAAVHSLRPRDQFDAPVAAGAIAPTVAGTHGSLSAMNHMRFECGVDLKSLLGTSRKRLWKSLWAAPDSPDALAIGYMSYNGTH